MSANIRATLRPIQAFATVISKPSLSYSHMFSALHFLELSKKVELENKGKSFSEGQFSKHHRAYVVGCILSCVASVEAYINEFYLEAIDDGQRPHLDEKHQALLCEIWGAGEQKFRVLEKYQKSLKAITKNAFAKGAAPYQDVQILIKLRNLLVHSKAEWDNKKEPYKKIEDNLKGKFALNPFFPETGSPFFPARCLSFGCSEWAVRASLDLIHCFLIMVGKAPQTEQYKHWAWHVDTFSEISEGIVYKP